MVLFLASMLFPPGRLPSHCPPRTNATVPAESTLALPAVAATTPAASAEQCRARAPLPIQPLPPRTAESCAPRSRARLSIPAPTHSDRTACPVAAAVPVPHHRQPDQRARWSLITTVSRPRYPRAAHSRAAAHHRGRRHRANASEHCRDGQPRLPPGPEDDRAPREERRVQPQAFRGRHHAHPRPKDDRAHLRVGQDGRDRRQVRGRLAPRVAQVRAHRAEARLRREVLRVQDPEHRRLVRRQVPHPSGGSCVQPRTVQLLRAGAFPWSNLPHDQAESRASDLRVWQDSVDWRKGPRRDLHCVQHDLHCACRVPQAMIVPTDV